MLTNDNMNLYYRYKPQAEDEFRTTMQLAENLLQADKNNTLTFPGTIDDKCHKVTWNYKSMLTDDDDEEKESYPFYDITFGLYVTTRIVLGEDHQKPYLTAFIGSYCGYPIFNLNFYDLVGELDMVKITNDISRTVLTIRELEMFISDMDPQRGEIVMILLSNLFDC